MGKKEVPPPPPSEDNSGMANIFQNSMLLIVDVKLDVDSGAAPYLGNIMDGFSDPEMEEIVLVKPAQAGGTKAVEEVRRKEETGMTIHYLNTGTEAEGCWPVCWKP